MKRSKKKINYFKLVVCIIILALAIFAITKAFSAIITKNEVAKAEENNLETNTVTDTNTLQNESNVENVVANDKPVRESKAIPLTNGQKSKKSISVLMYHYFYDASKGETGENSNWLEISKFEEQLKYLQKNDYYYPTWQEVADFVDGKIDLPEKSVVLTMDDGQKSLYNLAIPLLDKYNIPATAFIITKKFDTKNLEKYKNSTIDFQSHTNNMHRAGGTVGRGGIFTALSLEESVADLKESINKLNGNSDSLAYPFGDYTEGTKKAVKNAGFKVAFTTEYSQIKPGMDKYSLPRVRIYKDITLEGFKASI